MIAAVLGARPVTLRLARHLPPALDDVLALHGGDLAGPLAGEQDQLQRRVELVPQQRDLGVGQDALAVRGRIAVDQLARVDGEDLLPDRPREDRRRRRRAPGWRRSAPRSGSSRRARRRG